MNVVDAKLTPEDIYVYTLAEGYKWAGAALTYSFPISGAQFTGYAAGTEPSNNFEVLNSAQKEAVKSAFNSLSSFTNLLFTEQEGAGAGSAVLRFGMSDTPSTAYAYLPNSSERGGDAWFNNSGGKYDAPARGNYAWTAFMHEIGHSLGLDHPHESVPLMPLDRDQMAYTVMSYRSYLDAPLTGYTNGTWSFAQSYMMEDIITLQTLYGANYSYNSSDTAYSWSPITGEMFINGTGAGAPGFNRVFETVWDGGGNDTYDFGNYVSGVTVDLGPGKWTVTSTEQTPNLGAGVSSPGNIANSRLLNNDLRSLIENALGSSGSDLMRGNQVANRLDGNEGNDSLYGYEGNDRLYGGGGSDTLYGGVGADLMDGGAGVDTISFSQDEGSVFVNLTLGSGYGNAAQGDTYVSLENVVGSDYNDFIIGDAGVNRIEGGAGNDTIIGAMGPDVLIGGVGADWLSFEDNSGTIFVNLLTGTGFNNAAQGDTLIGFENVIGGLFDDTLIGDDSNNRLDGAMGADTLVGGAGADTFLFGHAPSATSSWGSANVDTIFDFVSGQDRIEINAVAYDGGLKTGVLAIGSLVVGTSATEADDRFIYDQANGRLYFDADGSGTGPQILMALLPNHNSIAASDFIIS